MNSAKTWLIVVLALTTIGGAIVAWRQHGEITALRAAAMPRDERANFQKRIWDLEKTNRDLAKKTVSQTEADTRQPKSATGLDSERGSDASAQRREANNAFTAIGKFMGNPEVVAMINLQQKGTIDSRYAALFKKLNLPPEQIEKLKTLLAERTASMQDIFAVAREQGVNLIENPAAMSKLVLAAHTEVDGSLRSLIGDAGFAQLRKFEQTLPQRGVIEDLQQRLSYTAAPLTPTQADQLIDILAGNPAQRTTGSARPSTATPFVDSPVALAETMGLRFISPQAITPATITPAAIAQSQSVLSPPQLTALQQMQQQQQAQQQLRKIVSDTLSPTGSGKK